MSDKMLPADPHIDPYFREFGLLMEATRTSQQRISTLLGTNPTTVNRWIKKDRPDAMKVPYYALAYLRAYHLLSADHRDALYREASADNKSRKGPAAGSASPDTAPPLNPDGD